MLDAMEIQGLEEGGEGGGKARFGILPDRNATTPGGTVVGEGADDELTTRLDGPGCEVAVLPDVFIGSEEMKGCAVVPEVEGTFRLIVQNVGHHPLHQICPVGEAGTSALNSRFRYIEHGNVGVPLVEEMVSQKTIAAAYVYDVGVGSKAGSLYQVERGMWPGLIPADFGKGFGLIDVFPVLLALFGLHGGVKMNRKSNRAMHLQSVINEKAVTINPTHQGLYLRPVTCGPRRNIQNC